MSDLTSVTLVSTNFDKIFQQFLVYFCSEPSPSYLHQLFPTTYSTSRVLRSNTQDNLNIPRPNTEKFKHSFQGCQRFRPFSDLTPRGFGPFPVRPWRFRPPCMKMSLFCQFLFVFVLSLFSNHL